MRRISLLLITCTLFCLAGALGAITDGKLVDFENNTISLDFDGTGGNRTLSYADGTGVSPNAYVWLSSNDFVNDLQDKFIGLAYVVANESKLLQVIPKQVKAAGAPVQLDLDLSPSRAFYPGVLSVVISDNFELSSATYYNLTNVTGLLNGSYGLVVENGTSVSVKVSNITDAAGALITTDHEYIIMGIRNVSGSVSDVVVTSPGVAVNLSNPGGDYEFVINGLVVSDYGQGVVPVVPAPSPSGGGGGGKRKQCVDGIDNDDDGYCDYDGCRCTQANNYCGTGNDSISWMDLDPGCAGYSDDLEDGDKECKEDRCEGSLVNLCTERGFFEKERGNFKWEAITETYGPNWICDNGVLREVVRVKPEEPVEPVVEVEQLITIAKAISIWWLELWWLWLSLLVVLLMTSGYLTYKKMEDVERKKQAEKLGKFILHYKAQGLTKKEIKDTLIKEGWPPIIVDEYLDYFLKKDLKN